jgi:hypothetical protein
LPNSQYKVKMDGTGRVSLRNRVFLRAIVPFKAETRENHGEVMRPDVLPDQPRQSLASGEIPAGSGTRVWPQEVLGLNPEAVGDLQRGLWISLLL